MRVEYPQSADDVPAMLEENPDAVLIDLDTDPESALELVENICVQSAATVMVYSRKPIPSCWFAACAPGRASFFPCRWLGIDCGSAGAGLGAAPAGADKKTSGKLLAFHGRQGRRRASPRWRCNFAVSLAQESGQKTVLIDLDLPLGDAALNLGIAAEFSTVDACRSTDRLDARFLAQLLVKHSSGVSVLAAPGSFSSSRQALKPWTGCSTWRGRNSMT